MDDTTRGLVNESMSGRGEEPPPEHASGPESRPDSDEDTHRRTREIRAEIEHTREEMSETIDAIQERLRPGNIVAGATERVREATTEGVRNMAESASETARNAMEKTREMTGDVAEFGRENAIPAALIGIGVAWLVIDRIRDDRNHRSWDRWNRDRESYRFSAAAYDPSGRYDRDSRSAASSWSDTTDRMASTARDAGRTASRTGRRAQNQLRHLMRENPLMAGAAAAVIGAAVGLSLPETERENEWLGDAKETVMDRAQDVARNAATAVQEAAGDMAGEVAKTVVGGKSTER